MKTVLLLTLCLSSLSFFGQLSKSEAKEENKKGENLIHLQHYLDALPIYQKIISSFPEDKNYRYHLAICQTHSKDYTAEGLNTLIDLSKTYKEDDFKDFAFHAAHAYYYNHRHQEAKIYFDKYKDHIVSYNDEYLTDYVNLQAKYNENALTLYHAYDSTEINISNLNLPLNTVQNEYCPFVTPDESAIYYTYTGVKSTGGKMNQTHKPDEKHGRYYEDIFVSYRDENGVWGEPQNLNTINTIENESCIGISHTGDYIFIFKSSKIDNGDLYFAKKIGNDWGTPIRFEGDVNTTSWEGAITMSIDGQKLYFASERPGGFGGRDLYSAELIGFNKWGNVKNLGATINSKYDEDAPYLLPNEQTLYFASNGINSMGGFDVFYSKKTDNKWSEAVNAGVPVNSIKDERFYSISADGQTGYFSRTNEHSLHEDQDLYDVNPGMIGEKPVMALISGKVFLDNTNENANIVLRDAETGKIVGQYATNPKTHLFSMMVNPDKKYIMDVMVDGKKQYSDSLDTDFIEQFIKLQHNYHLYSDDYHGEVPVLRFSLQKHLETVHNKETGEDETKEVIDLKQAFAAVKNDTLELHHLQKAVGENRIQFYKDHPELAAQDGVTPDVLDEAHQLVQDGNHHNLSEYQINKHMADENLTKEQKQNLKKAKEMLNPNFDSSEVVYRVQVAAYRRPENYHWTNKDSFGDVLEATYPDGITRFTIGGTKHMVEVEKLKQKLISFGIKDAFIVAFKGDQRIPLYGLIKQ